MKTILKTIILFSIITLNAQQAPLLDHEWTIEKIVTEDEVIMADLNPFGEYDQFMLEDESVLDNTTFFYFLFGSCESYLSFDQDLAHFYYYVLGCTLSDDSSQIAIFFNEVFVLENTDEVTMENEFYPKAYGPFIYEFREDEDFIYLDITNSVGDVATFWASTLSSSNFEESDFTIYPNPVTNQLYIESQEAFQRVEVFTINGKRILEVDHQENQPMDVSSLPSGMYMLKIETENGSITKKLVKE